MEETGSRFILICYRNFTQVYPTLIHDSFNLFSPNVCQIEQKKEIWLKKGYFPGQISNIFGWKKIAEYPSRDVTAKLFIRVFNFKLARCGNKKVRVQSKKTICPSIEKSMEIEVYMRRVQKCSAVHYPLHALDAGNTKGGRITVPLISCLTGLE